MNRRGHSRVLSAVAASALLSTLLSSVSHAEVTRTGDEPWYQDTKSDVRRAKVLFAQAVDTHLQLLRGDARDLYDQALALWDNPDIRWNLALVLEDLGQYLHAHQQLDRALQWGAALGAERLRDVRDRMAELETQRLARLEASTDESATDITLDGQPWLRGVQHGNILVEPGQHYVSARKPGFFPVTRAVVVTAGQMARVALPMDEDRLIETRRWSMWKPWAAVTAGVVTAGIGVLVERQAIRNRDAAARALPPSCKDPTGCAPTRAPTVYGRAVRDSRIALGAFVAGGTTLAVGLAMAWMNQPRVYRTEARAPRPIEISPILSTNQAGVSAQLQF